MDQDLQKAIAALKIRDVYLRTTHAQLADDFEPKYDPQLDTLEIQFRHAVTQFSILKLEQEGEDSISLFRVFIELGARWLVPDSASDGNEGERARATVTGTMVAEYEMTYDPGSEALTSFAKRNASYHVWPYWREFLASQCLRMNLPKIMLPAVQLPMASGQDGADSIPKAD